jgi:spore coat protein U-like protein
MRKLLSVAIAAGAMTILASSVGAATLSSSFTVTATVQKTCAISSSSNMTFPTYTPAGGPQVVTGGVSVKCTNGTPFTVALSAGSTTGSTVAQRLLANGTNTLQYNLFVDTAWTKTFGDGTTGTLGAGTGTGVANAVTVPVYGQILDSAFNQAAAPGTYTDTINVTVTY